MLVLTQGDPSCIGPEITIKAWHSLKQDGPAFVWLGDPALLAPHVPTQVMQDIAQGNAVFPHAIPVLPLPLAAPAYPGKPDTRNAGGQAQ